MSELLRHYPEANRIVNETEVLATEEFLSRVTAPELEAWTAERTEVRELANGQRYRMVVDTPAEANDEVLIVSGEFGNGINPAVTARALAVRAMISAEASLVIHPNSSYGQDNAGFSKDERLMLVSGRVDPLLHRLRHTLDEHGLADRPATIYGPSQGAVLASAYGAHPDTAVKAVSLVEPPHTSAKSRLRLGQDFMASGGKLAANTKLNFSAESSLGRDILRDQSPIHMAKFALGVMKSDNVALLNLLRSENLEADIARTLNKQAGVTHAWGLHSRVTGSAASRSIADRLAGRDNYASYEFSGELADHSLTNVYVLNAALTRAAIKLSAN